MTTTRKTFHFDGCFALITPASPLSDQQLEDSLKALDTLGIRYRLGQHVGARHRYLGGTTQQRLDDLYAAFEQPDVDAIWCLRGGYGSAHLLPEIDWRRLRGAKARPLIGFSDISLLLSAFHRHGLPAIHGPQAGALGQLAGAPEAERPARLDSLRSLESLLQQPQGGFSLQHVAGPTGPVQGELIGGNLTALASACGWRESLHLPERGILLLEDVGESYYRLERSFHQLLLTLDPSRLKAVCLGHFTDCPRRGLTQTIEAIFAEHLAPLGIPLYQGLPIGHGSENHAWPYGRPATLEQGQLYW